MKPFSELKRNLKLDFSEKKKLKLAVLGDTATQFYAQALRGLGYDFGFDFQIFEADFNQIERQIFDLQSELYAHEPDVIIIFQSAHKLLSKYNKADPARQANLSDDRMEEIKSLVDTISSHLSSKIIYLNYPEIDDSIFGSYANKVRSSFLFQQRKLNYELMLYASFTNNFYICDLSTIQNTIGKKELFQAPIYVNTEMVLGLEAIPSVAGKTIDIIATMYGNFKKCVILDLDNTLWGGVIGDDGIENIQLGSLGIGKAFSEFQYWIKKLKNRGIILAVCSKNTESIAKSPFEQHPDMVLRLEDIAIFIANWENKADNIRHIQSILNIGFDSMVFLDDNPFERNIVRQNIPGICVPELPEDPAEYLEYLYSLNLFETVSFSGEDTKRTKQYQEEAQRSIVQKSFTNEDDFLQNLDMQSTVEAFNKFNTPRVAQLSQRSNQFNLRTIRYSESDIERISVDTDYFTFSFTLEDKFGDNGLIAAIILKRESDSTLFIDTWFMSCRVLKRGMENFTLNTLVDFAKQNRYRILKGEYIPTEKNGLVKDHFLNLGFEESSGFWLLNVDEYNKRKTFIRKK